MISDDVRKLGRLFIQMYRHPPDLNEPQPFANRKEVIFALSLTFLTVSWVAVLLRLYTRVRIVRDPGWDDFFVVLSALVATADTVTVLMMVEQGLGSHFITLSFKAMFLYLKTFYFSFGLYVTSGTTIKISLLLQYLRLFKAGTMRWICITLLGLVSLFGLAFGFLAWVPCWPVSYAWNRFGGSGTCYGFAFTDAASYLSVFVSHAALNMALDLAIFATPLVLFKKRDLNAKSILPLIGIFAIGAVAVLTSVWRLYSVIITEAGTKPYLDPTWLTPPSILVSGLEVKLALICASMPVFWPTIEARFMQIFVTREVQVTQRSRDDLEALTFETRHPGSASSMQTFGPSSYQGTSFDASTPGKMPTTPYSHYRDQYFAAHFDPGENQAGSGMGNETEIESEAKHFREPKWII